MDCDLIVSELKSSLAAHANQKRAEFEKHYQKSDLEFLGTGVPVIRMVARKFNKGHKTPSHDDFWRLFDKLWQTRVWESRMVGLAILESCPSSVEIRDLPTIRKYVIDASGWAMNDWFGCHIIGALVRRSPEALKVMDQWSADENLWVRRVAMQSLLLPMRAGDLAEWARFVRYAEPRVEDKDFWTRKVIGWVCREVSKKNPGPVFEFLFQNRTRVSGLTLREGAKYLPVDDRIRLGLE